MPRIITSAAPMEAEATESIKRIGTQLGASQSCPGRTELLKLLKEAEIAFTKLKQSQILKTSIKPLQDSLFKHGLLYHKDKYIRLVVGICISEVIRTSAPDPDFGPGVSKEIFAFLLNIFGELGDVTSQDFNTRAIILETVCKHGSCLVMLNSGCEDLVLKMLKVFFSVVREDHSEGLINSMALFIAGVLEEEVDFDYDEVSYIILDAVLHNFIYEKEGIPPPSFRLAGLVIQNRGVKLDRCICYFLKSCILNADAVESVIKEYYHEIIFELYQIAPQMLQSVIPSLTHELLIDQVDARIKALKLIKKLVFLPGSQFAREHPYVYLELLNRFFDKSTEIRRIALSCAKALYTTASFRGESVETLCFAIRDRFLDHHDKVRAEAVALACELVNVDFSSQSMDLITCVAERLRDKKDFVRSKALKSLVDLYQEYCRRCEAATMQFSDRLEEIPCKLLMLCYAKECQEFGLQRVDLLLADLFPASLSIEERTKHWILMFSLFKLHHVKALKAILLKKQRLQDWLKDYLETLDIAQENSCGETDKKFEALVVKMSSCFLDPAEAKVCLQRFKELKCGEIYNFFQRILCEGSTSDSKINPEDAFVKEFGNQHELSEFLQLLSTKCSYKIFGLKHVQFILESLLHDDAKADRLRNYKVQLLLVIIGALPSLLRGSKKSFLELLENGNIPFNELLILIDILVRERCHSSIELKDIYPFLEKVCLFGSRAQSKLAVSAIAASSDMSKGHVFSKLSKKLVDSLRGENVGTVLQSLGCMAQLSSSTFECHQVAITDFIFQEIFQQITPIPFEEHCVDGTSKCCTTCQLKIFGLKALARSFCPYDHTFISCSINHLLDIILQMLQNGRSSFGVFSCEFDDAFIRLAAAKSVLRLSRKWDFHVSRQIFHLTILMAKDHSPMVRRSFTNKVHMLLKNHAVPIRYACTFSFAALDMVEDLRRDGFKFMEDFIREYSKEAQMLNTVTLDEAVNHPAYMVVFLIDILAHESSFPSPGCQAEKLWSRFLSPLFITVQALVSERLDDGSLCFVLSAYSFLRSIFNAIKRADDAVDGEISPKLHLLADVGISILEAVNGNNCYTPPCPGLVLLPSSLYKVGSSLKKQDNNTYPFLADAIFMKNLVSRLRADVSEIVGFEADRIQELCDVSILQTCTRHVIPSSKIGSKHTPSSNQLHVDEPAPKRTKQVHCKEPNADRNIGIKCSSACDSTMTRSVLATTRRFSSEEGKVTECDMISAIPAEGATANGPESNLTKSKSHSQDRGP